MDRSGVRIGNPTYWNDLRLKNGYKLSDIAITLGTSVSNVGKWFSGRYVPCDKDIHDICDLFGVDYEEGKSEFIKARDSWKSGRTGKNRFGLSDGETPNSAKCCKDFDNAESAPSVTIDISDGNLARANDELLKLIYGKISWDAYETARVAGVGENLLEALYNKISFEEFDSIYSLVRSRKKT